MEKLDQILLNTDEIKKTLSTTTREINQVKEKARLEKQEQNKQLKAKEAELKKEKDKRKEQVKEAVKKFKQIKTNINEELQEKVNERVQELDTNTSNYLQTLIKQDLNESLTTDKKKFISSMSLFEFIKLKYL